MEDIQKKVKVTIPFFFNFITLKKPFFGCVWVKFYFFLLLYFSWVLMLESCSIIIFYLFHTVSTKVWTKSLSPLKWTCMFDTVMMFMKVWSCGIKTQTFLVLHTHGYSEWLCWTVNKPEVRMFTPNFDECPLYKLKFSSRIFHKIKEVKLSLA